MRKLLAVLLLAPILALAQVSIWTKPSINWIDNPMFSGTSTASGHLLFTSDNTYDIGASGATRPRTIYLGTNVVAGSVIQAGVGVVAPIVLTSIPVTETNATHTVAASTSHLIANRATTITVTLPTPASNAGRILWIKTIQAATVVSAASDVIPRAGGAAGTAILAATDGAWAMLVCNGTAWELMAGTP